MISDQVPKLIGDQFDQPSNVHGKTGPKLINDQLCLVFPYVFDLQLHDQGFVDSPSAEPTLCQSDCLAVTLICSVVLNYPACTASARRSQ